MDKELASIVIPAYNAERYIVEAVESAIAQTYSPKEVIVVDDGSSDRTAALLEPYSKSEKIVYIRQANKGLAGARNTGINAAKGEYIALLDSDDIFLPNKLEEQINALERHPECGVCYCDLVHFTDTKPREFFHHEYNTLSGDIFRALLRKQFINPLAIVAKKEVFENYGMFNESLRRSEDWDLWLRWARQGVTFYHLTAVLAQYRMRTEGNLSSLDSEPQMKQKNLEIFEALAQAMSPEEREIYSLSAIVATMRRKVALAYLLIGDKKMALAVPGLSIANRFAIKMIPGKAFEYSGRSLRRWKHRLLLKKV